MKLSIIVPAYNEEKRLGRMLDEYVPFLTARLGDTFELIIVVNGSTDGTAALARSYAEQWPRHLRVLVEPAAIGKGGAVMLGLRAAIGDCAGYVDADGSTPPAAFLDLVERAGTDCPVVIASRWCRGASVFPPQPPIRRVASRVFNLVTRCLFGLKLHDTQCGAKVFHRSALDRVLSRPGIITRWAFDVDLLYQVRREGLEILEVPTVWRDVEGSKLTVTETSLEMLAALVRLRLMYSPLRWIVGLYDRYLVSGKTTEESLRKSLLFGVGGQLSNIFNLAFQVLAAHILLRRGGAGAYGDMAAALGVVAFLGTSLSGSVDSEPSETGNGAAAARGGAWMDSWPVILLLAVLLLPAVLHVERIAAILGMERVWPVYLAMALGMVHVHFSLDTATLMSQRNGRSAALLNVLHSMLRLIAAGVLLGAGFGVEGVLGGALAGTVAGGVGAALLVARMPATRRPLSGGLRWLPVLPMAGFALLGGADVLLVKMRFSPDAAGEYALASMMARMVFFLPMPLAAAAFSRAAGASSMAVRRRELATILFCVLIPAVLIVVGAGAIARVMTGGAPGATVSLLRSLTAAYIPLPLLSLLLHYGLSRQRFAAMALIMASSGGAFVLAVLLPAAISRDGVVLALGTVNVLCLAALMLVFRQRGS
jgi:glycosyltransferase involved in cell wall biosynthesis